MKKIEAIIRSSKFYEIKDALHNAGIDFFTYTDVKGVGNQRTEKATYRGTEYDLGSIARTKLEIVVSSDKFLEAALDAILQVGKTGEIGDGKIFISKIDKAIRIRDGKQDIAAIDVPLYKAN